MTLVWSQIVRLGKWAPIDSEEHIDPSELDVGHAYDKLNGGHVRRLADSIRQHGYSPERHGQLGLNLTDHGENIYHHASGSETHPEDHLHHAHLLKALQEVGHGPVPVHIHDQQSDPDGEPAPRYWHGTTAEGLEQVHPNYGAKGNFGNNLGIHEPGYAYATGRSSAKSYADQAALTHGGRPRVYEVHPNGPVEEDPSHDQRGNARGNYADDMRSRHGFTVVGEEDLGHEHEGWA
ncbi:NAD(+)--rifampin ADP-ribosyltransferase [Streptomyces griseoaurantiacus]|uniref:NAD(+)--rifampin ADP-ribosyltransferase n=1 Tax=Streptomyces griseoaurantiacus TaxID=68213 RepID=UPI0036865AF2